MSSAPELLYAAHRIYARNAIGGNGEERPGFYKIVGILLAVASGIFIGISFVLKKIGLLKANEKYNEEAGEGYGYLKNGFWWGGMVLMILGEVCNLGAYAFTDAILVTTLGALSVVITAVLSAIFLKERLSMVGKVSCFLCLVGAVVIVLNAPQQSAVANIEQMKDFVVHPLFLTYAGIIIVGSVICAFWAGPKWGKKNMLVYLSICSWVGGLSVVATQGLGAAIVTQAEGKPQFNQWFLYIVLIFVIGTLLVEVVYLNVSFDLARCPLSRAAMLTPRKKALNLFNAAMVTPTYYVYFTSATIITSAILFRGFKGTGEEIASVVMGFLTICCGVVLLQLSKSAKDVPDTAVFSGNLDQIQTIAEQEQSETDPKADAIRGTAAIVRRFSSARMKMEAEELRRLHEEKRQDQLASVSEDGPVYEWDGLRRRKTVNFGSRSSRPRSATTGTPFSLPRTPEVHPPLGMSRFPTEDEENRPSSPGVLSSFAGTIRSRGRSILSSHPPDLSRSDAQQSPMHPVPLTEISVPAHKRTGPLDFEAHDYATEYTGASGLYEHRNASQRSGESGASSHLAPTPPPHSSARRQFSFHNPFRRNPSPSQAEEIPPPPRSAGHLARFGIGSRGHSSPHVKNATEEERLGLVHGDSKSMPALPRYDGHDDDDDDDDDHDGYIDEDKRRMMMLASSSPPQDSRYGRGITSPPRRESDEEGDWDEEVATYSQRRSRYNESAGGSSRGSPPPPQPPPHRTPPHRRGPGGQGSFM